jgi:lysophospholipase L1-like esterase
MTEAYVCLMQKWVAVLAVCFLLAAGSDAAVSGTTRTLHVIAIGDSLPYGQADCGGCRTFIQLFGTALARATGATVDVRNLSEHTGIDSGDLARELTSSSTLRPAVAAADAITVTVGHNDTPWNSYTDSCDGTASAYPNGDWSKYNSQCLTSNVGRYAANLGSILRQIRTLRHGKPTLLRVTNDYNDIIGDPRVAKRAYPIAKRFVDAYAARTCRIAKSYHGICIDTYHAFNGPSGTRDASALLSVRDHTHPNARGHRLIAALLIRAGFQPLHG